MTKTLLFAAAAMILTAPLAAQDTTRVDQGVRIGVDYSPGMRPGLVVVPGAGLDSVRAMVRRDLDYTDRFEMVTVASSRWSSSRARAGSRPGSTTSRKDECRIKRLSRFPQRGVPSIGWRYTVCRTRLLGGPAE